MSRDVQAATQDIAIGLGSNLGDKAATVREAAARLERDGTVQGLVLSRLYRTPPWGPVAQDWFVNACLAGRTAMAPTALLAHVKALEVAMGRTETVRWGPRVIDIDILYYGDVELETPELTLPHREILRRAFVLVPLAEIRPQRRIVGVTLQDAIARLSDPEITPLDPAQPP